ncbi:BatD family protein [Photobacterium alginatilyticum]|uniref:BatD family protein n=1 Tax=Photobacterium alginatilyticum TaxID=1775171 RepID=UPI004069831D
MTAAINHQCLVRPFFHMASRYMFSLCFALWFVFCLAGLPAYASGLSGDNTETPVVEVKAWLDDKNQLDDGRYAVNQQVILYIDVATPRWFTGGTRIASIEIPGVIVKQRNSLATNYSQRKEGVTWSHQRWEITLYPQQSGRFVVPSIDVDVQVSVPDGRSVKGRIATLPLTFDVSLPSPLLIQNGHWLSASELKIEEQWELSRDAGELKVGDAITRTVTVHGEDTLSVLIPPILPSYVQQEQQQTVTNPFQVYVQPSKLSDSQERGNYRSSRLDQAVYIVQSGGDIVFPALELLWWNTSSQQLETLSLPEKHIRAHHTWRSWLRTYWLDLALFGVSMAVLSLSGLLASHYYNTRPTPAWWQFCRALCRGDLPQARLLIYRRLHQRTGLVELAKADQLCSNISQSSKQVKWYELQYHFQVGKVSVSLFVRLWSYLGRCAARKNGRYLRFWTLPKALPQLQELPHKTKK